MPGASHGIKLAELWLICSLEIFHLISLELRQLDQDVA